MSRHGGRLFALVAAALLVGTSPGCGTAPSGPPTSQARSASARPKLVLLTLSSSRHPVLTTLRACVNDESALPHLEEDTAGSLPKEDCVMSRSAGAGGEVIRDRTCSRT